MTVSAISRQEIYREIRRDWFVECEIADLSAFCCTVTHKVAALP
jgi:hypothetical protein